jgi:hypothetical protein
VKKIGGSREGLRPGVLTNAGQVIAQLLYYGFSRFAGAVAPQPAEEHREVIHLIRPYRLAATGSHDFDLNIMAGRDEVRTQALVEARHDEVGLVFRADQLHGQALPDNLGGHEPVEAPFHGSDVEFCFRGDARRSFGSGDRLDEREAQGENSECTVTH